MDVLIENNTIVDSNETGIRMAGMRPGGKFQQERSDDEYEAAVKLFLAMGYGSMDTVCKQTGIPKSTLSRKVSEYKKAQGIADIPEPPPPGDDAVAQMADMVIDAAYKVVYQAASPEAIAATGKPDLKACIEAGTAVKTWMGLGKLSPQTKAKASALSSLTDKKAA